MPNPDPDQPRLTFTDVPGVRVGHWTDPVGMTGCTVVLTGPRAATAGVDVRGSAPGTLMTDVLDPRAANRGVHGVLLTGGSAFGLAAASGVTDYLEALGIGNRYGDHLVPIVPAAVIFDLGIGEPRARPTREAGWAACVDADRSRPLTEGSVGVGTGATVGKILGLDRGMKGGIGGHALRLPDGTIVGALAVSNAVGDVVDADGRVLAGARADDGGFAGAEGELLRTGRSPLRAEPGNTTLAVIATDARLSPVECRRVASQAHDALAMTIVPVHTIVDGDTVFALSLGDRLVDPMIVGIAAVAVLREAVRRSVRLSRGGAGVPGLADAE